MATNPLFLRHTLGNLTLPNSIVMSPMTRSRAINNIPNDLMATYYAQRAQAGLIITEGISPSPNGLGYARIPGLFSDEQIEGWKKVTKAVHAKGGRIFAQLMHTGRIAHADNLPETARVFAPSAVKADGKMWTDKNGMQDFPIPFALTLEEIESTKHEFIQAARNAMVAGFDGVELHAANGYLLEQFLSPYANLRTDQYGGNIANRARFVLEVAAGVSSIIGKERTGIRISPFGVFNDMPHYAEIHNTYTYLAEQLNTLGLAYIHLLDHSAGGGPDVPLSIKTTVREKFKNSLILAGGFNHSSAMDTLSEGLSDLVAFGKPFISNPDLVERFRKNFPLNVMLDASTLYTAGGRGYTDYPVFEEETVSI